MLSLNAMAYDFSYTYQGKTLYYYITSSNTVCVTYYNYNYVSGAVVIPSSVTNSGTTYSVTSIGNSAFYNCSSLTSVTIPNSVTSIGEVVFYNCSSLTSVTIPNSVTSIGGGAFEDCSSLTSVTIPNSVTTIGDWAFSDCSSLTSITIPNSVTSIGYEAFYNCSSLTSVTIGNSVTEIGSSAFYNCSSLTSVIIGNSVTSIGGSAFYGCNSLTSVTIPNSVTSIGDNAFRDCSRITCLASNPPTLGSNVFSASAIITIPMTNFASYASSDWNNYNINFEHYGLSYHFTENNTVAVYSFDATITSAIIPSSIQYGSTTYSVTSIGNSAFRDCSSLTSVTIPNSVTSIGNSAFSGCNSLTSVTIPESVTSIGNNAFKNCSSLTTLNFNAVNCSDFASGIGHQFYSCPITTINIGNSVQRIPANFARGLSSLTSVTIPNSVTSIGNRAFYDCSRLTTLNFNAVNCSDFASGIGHQFYSCPISTINIGDSVQRIPAYFAYNLDSLTFVTIPNSVTYIGAWAFRGCSSLTSVTIPNSVTSIGNSAFCSCSNLTSVNIPESATSIKDSTFLGCSSLTSVTIPNSVTSIGNSAFCSCSNLTSVNIPESATSIKDSTFLGCSSLTSVTIPNSITYIGNGAFSGCSSLTSVTIPESVTSIGYEAFCGCSSLTTLNFNAINCNDLASGNGHQFYSCPLANINFGDSVQRIPANFAENKSDLISISIPDNITEIGNRAFQGCSGLIAVTIGNGVNNIYSNSFRGCTNLTYLTIGSGVETIEDLAFIDCNMLSHITSKATTPPEIASSNVFPYPNECSLTVPCGSLGAYTDQMNRWYLLFNPRIDEDIVFAFSVSANDDAFGIVSNEALSCSVRKITAIPFDGYEFVSWNDGNTSNPRTINITNDTSFVAVFATIGSSALQEVESTREFVLYPNPTSGFVTIEFEALQESSLLRIIDLGGRVVKTFDIATGTETLRLDLRDLPSGVYTLMIGNTTKKLIIE